MSTAPPQPPSAPTAISRQYDPDKEKRRFLSKLGLALTNTSSLEEFVVGRTIGVGSFGRVLLYRHRKTQHLYAAKIMNKEKMVRMNQVLRVIEEKRVLQSVACKFLVDLRFSFKTNSNLYLLMPFIPGGELFTLLKQRKRLDQIEVKFYSAQVALAFEYLHSIDVLYRDLKPENIILNCDGYVKLVDMGFAKYAPRNTTSFIGTPEYMAPEMLIKSQREKGYSNTVDWWSFGVLIYELSVGTPPFTGDNLFQIFNRIIKKKYTLPSGFDDIFKDLLDKIFQPDVTIRLGCGKDGAVELKKHPWFAEINWSAVFDKQITPKFIPTCNPQKEDGNFPRYDEEPVQENEQDEYTELFNDF
ncbi:cAMP-dependent protein kinase catalytic subunit gamma-like [Planococcus citri]|uniref:cAMP-dependent protein kinase catalytic subunit gamma-like n=1 Tax=Planococcus citri TaxID=170843 RepID=UPI0031F8ECB2